MNQTITYSESVGQPTFDWWAFLCKQSWTTEEKENAAKLATEWTTCACGNQCAIIPRNSVGTPDDMVLRALGMMFFNFIWDFADFGSFNDIEAAREVMIEIEKRSSYLISKIMAEKEEANERCSENQSN